jgi:uncharacterized protein
MNLNHPLVWVIIDNKIGNANQAIALAEALGFDYEIKKLKYNFLANLPNWCKFDSLLGVKNSDLKGNPDLVISSGRRTAAVSSYIKKNSPQTFNIHIMNPDMSLNKFDYVILPYHDQCKKHQKYNNIIYITGALSNINNQQLRLAGEEFLGKNLHLKPPFITVIIGGKTKKGDYNLKQIEILLRKATDLAKNIDATLLISNSRRTSYDISSKLSSFIDTKYFFYNWHENNGENNPYQAFLFLSNYIIVTGDSVSICCEALSTGKPVYVFQDDDILPKKHLNFLNKLFEEKYIKHLVKNTYLESWKYQPLKEAKRIANFFKSLKIIN